MKATKPGSRHGLTAPMVRVRLQGFRAIDRRTVGGRGALAFRSELIVALGGEADLSPQRRLRVAMCHLELRDQGAALVKEREGPLHEGHGARSGLLTHGAATVNGNAALCNARPMPRDSRPRPPAPDDRQAALPLPPARRKPPTPEQIAKVVTAKLKSPVGMPPKAERALRRAAAGGDRAAHGAGASGELP